MWINWVLRRVFQASTVISWWDITDRMIMVSKWNLVVLQITKSSLISQPTEQEKEQIGPKPDAQHLFGIKYFGAKCSLSIPRLALIYAVLKCEFSYRHISRTPNFRVKNMASRCDLYASIYGIEEFTSTERREQRDKILLQDYAATAPHFVSSNTFYFILMSPIIGSVGSMPQEIKFGLA